MLSNYTEHLFNILPNSLLNCPSSDNVTIISVSSLICSLFILVVVNGMVVVVKSNATQNGENMLPHQKIETNLRGKNDKADLRGNDYRGSITIEGKNMLSDRSTEV